MSKKTKNPNKKHPLYAVILFLIKIVYTLIYRPHFHGTENIPAKALP
jgi:1-acyl-sn-glycerol-3-phosphate acyltransferase